MYPEDLLKGVLNKWEVKEELYTGHTDLDFDLCSLGHCFDEVFDPVLYLS